MSITASDPGAGYREVLTAIITSKVKALGKLAVQKVRTVPGLVVEDSGVVTAVGADGVQALDAVLDIYERLAGRTSTHMARIAILPLLSRFPTLALPDRLRR
ncbi:MAG: hypothetical protein HY904_10705 [Deltaproteobacteria bacterium]|nr:hypothetical protein [Deltaproteobacteria bacterium]